MILLAALGFVSYRKYLSIQANALVVAYTEVHRTRSERHLAEFLKDKLELKRLEFLNPAKAPDPRKDAGSRLNPLVSWRIIGGPARAGRGFKEYVREATAFEKNASLLKAWKDDWVEHASEVFGAGQAFVDFSWMSGLQGFEIWNLDAADPVRKELSLNTKLLPEDLPAPDWAELASWVQLRLLKGIAGRAILPALQESRQLIRLLFTTENMDAHRIGVQLLNREAQAVRHYRIKVDPKFSGWTPLPAETITAFTAYLAAMPGMLNTATDPETILEAFDEKGTVIGLCAALNELASELIRDRKLLSDAYAYSIASIDTIIRKQETGCRIPQVKRLWDEGPYLPPVLAKSPFELPELPELPGLDLFFTLFTFEPLQDFGKDGLPIPLRAASAARRGVGIGFKRALRGGDPWALYSRRN